MLEAKAKDIALIKLMYELKYKENYKFIDESKTVANFPVIVGARMSDDPLSLCDTKDDEFTATAIEFFDNGEIDLNFTNSKHEIIKSVKVK